MSLEKNEQSKREPFWKQLLVLLSHSFKIYIPRLISWHHPKLTVWRDLHPKVDRVSEQFLETRWLQKWLDRLEKNTYRTEEAKKVALNQDLILKNTKLNFIVCNKGVLRKLSMKKWKNSTTISIFNQSWANISHLSGSVTKKMNKDYNEENKLLIINSF